MARRRRSIRLIRDLLLAGLSFALGALAVRPLIPPAEGGRLDAKLEYFAKHRDEYDAVYFGASRVFRGLDPVRVDAALAAAGVESRSFNFAESGIWAFEQDYLYHRVMAMEPARLRRVYYGGRPLGRPTRKLHAFEQDPNLESQRGVQWHTLRQTRELIESTLLLDLPLLETLDICFSHLRLLGRNLGNYGGGRRFAGRLFASPNERSVRMRLRPLMHATQGYYGLQKLRGRAHDPVIETLMADPTEFERNVERIQGENAQAVRLEEINLGVYRDQQEAARRRGIELVYFTAPGYEGSPEHLRLFEQGVLPELFHFNDPARFPELFQLEHRFDLGHLNRAGSERFSARFAEAILERQGRPGRLENPGRLEHPPTGTER